MSANTTFRAIKGILIGENEALLAPAYPTRGISYQFQNHRTIHKTADELPMAWKVSGCGTMCATPSTCVVLCRASTALAQRRSPRAQLAGRQKINSVLTIRH